MGNTLHNKLLETVNRLEVFDFSLAVVDSWSNGGPFIKFIQSNDLSSRLVLLVLSKRQFVNTVIVDNEKLKDFDKEDLLKWNFSISEGLAGFSYNYGDLSSVRLEVGIGLSGTHALQNSIPLVFSRRFDGFLESNKSYYEINQNLVHSSDLHWLPDKKAFCKIDRLGDIEEVINITKGQFLKDEMNLVSCEPNVLEEFLAATNSSLVRLFDFQYRNNKNFTSSSDQVERVTITESPNLFYEKIQQYNKMLSLRGVQIIKLHTSQEIILKKIMDEDAFEKKEYVDFIAFDWRHNSVTTISTHPDSTCNYFNASEVDKPFELSPAFFRPEVLLKYKADPDKYLISDGYLNCRNAWTLRGLDFNDSGQIHVYICDLARLPYEEQLYWRSFNEKPKGSISERAIRTDFLAQWYSLDRNFDKLESTLQKWEVKKVGWWKPISQIRYGGFEFPISDNRKEWVNHISELTKLVIEGFQLDYVKGILIKENILFSKDEANWSITLLERLINIDSSPGSYIKLNGLRNLQKLRSTLFAHESGEKALEIATEKRLEYDSFDGHFQNLCKIINDELLIIEEKLD